MSKPPAAIIIKYRVVQGCQIFLGTTYQKVKNMVTKYTKWSQNIPNGYKMYQIDQMAQKIPTSLNARPSKIYPNFDFWF
jgi:hypothetical protein